MNKKKEYRVFLSLSESEAIALSKLGDREMRDLRTQAKYLLHQKLIELGLLPDDKENISDQEAQI